jgi:hypothetical protein
MDRMISLLPKSVAGSEVDPVMFRLHEGYSRRVAVVSSNRGLSQHFGWRI